MDRLASATYPLLDREFPYALLMARTSDESTASNTAKVFADNLNALMAAHPDLGSNPKLSKKTGLGTGSLSRFRNGEVDPNLGTLEKVAGAFHVEVWQLLVPHLDPANLPALQPLSESERRLYARLAEAVKEIKEGT